MVSVAAIFAVFLFLMVFTGLFCYHALMSLPFPLDESLLLDDLRHRRVASFLKRWRLMGSPLNRLDGISWLSHACANYCAGAVRAILAKGGRFDFNPIDPGNKNVPSSHWMENSFYAFLNGSERFDFQWHKGAMAIVDLMIKAGGSLDGIVIKDYASFRKEWLRRRWLPLLEHWVEHQGPDVFRRPLSHEFLFTGSALMRGSDEPYRDVLQVAIGRDENHVVDFIFRTINRFDAALLPSLKEWVRLKAIKDVAPKTLQTLRANGVDITLPFSSNEMNPNPLILSVELEVDRVLMEDRALRTLGNKPFKGYYAKNREAQQATRFVDMIKELRSAGASKNLSHSECLGLLARVCSNSAPVHEKIRHFFLDWAKEQSWCMPATEWLPYIKDLSSHPDLETFLPDLIAHGLNPGLVSDTYSLWGYRLLKCEYDATRKEAFERLFEKLDFPLLHSRTTVQSPLFHSLLLNDTFYDWILSSPAAVDLEERDHMGRTPLLAAVALGKKYLISRLVERGASLEARDNKDMGIHEWAILSHSADMLRLVCSYHPLTPGYPILAWAFGLKRSVDLTMFEALNQCGADWCARAPNGNTTLGAWMESPSRYRIFPLGIPNASLLACFSEENTAGLWPLEAVMLERLVTSELMKSTHEMVAYMFRAGARLRPSHVETLRAHPKNHLTPEERSVWDSILSTHELSQNLPNATPASPRIRI